MTLSACAWRLPIQLGERNQMKKNRLFLTLCTIGLARLCAAAEPDWAALTRESARNLSALIKINTTNPPGSEGPAAEAAIFVVCSNVKVFLAK